MIVGVDEVGRGPLAGCVVAGALHIEDEIDLPLKDSKSLSHAQREHYFEQFKDKVVFALGLATREEIDTYNILEATFIACNRAIALLIEKHSHLKDALFIVDGNRFKTGLPIRYECVVGADKRVREVACASIVAKLFRDHLMGVADFCFPRWGFSTHKGYPTPEHLNLVRRQALSPLHRKSFCICAKKKKANFTKRKPSST